MGYTLGVDIGTYETKGVIVDADGAIIGQAARAHDMLVPRPGWAEHRAEEDWWGDFVHVTKELMTATGIGGAAIDAVACSAIGPCMLPVDSHGTPLGNGVLYGVDTRATAQIDMLNTAIGEDVILARCGNALTSQSVGPKILWFKQTHQDLFARTGKILTSTSYVNFRLSGVYAIDHYTAANFSPYYDFANRDWCFDLDNSIDRSLLPELFWSSDIIGAVTPEAAGQTGLATGTPVICGTIDAAAEAISVGAGAPGDMMMMYGSTVFIILIADRQLDDPRLWHAPWLFEGQNAAMAGLATSGTLTHWFRRELASELPAQTAFASLAAEAAATPKGAQGLICLPYFSGERTPIHDRHAKGAFFGLNLTHSRGHLYRAAIEAIAYATRHITETFGQAGQHPQRVLAVGGGVKNPIWLQATSDVTGLEQIVSQTSTGASYGDAFLAALAIGRAQAGDIAKWNPPQRMISAEHSAIYDRQYALFRKLYEQTREIAEALG